MVRQGFRLRMTILDFIRCYGYFKCFQGIVRLTFYSDSCSFSCAGLLVHSAISDPFFLVSSSPEVFQTRLASTVIIHVFFHLLPRSTLHRMESMSPCTNASTGVSESPGPGQLTSTGEGSSPAEQTNCPHAHLSATGRLISRRQCYGRT
jgi:hypothetical protein